MGLAPGREANVPRNESEALKRQKKMRRYAFTSVYACRYPMP